MLVAALSCALSTPMRSTTPGISANTPQGIFRTANYREASALSEWLAAQPGSGKRIAVIGGGLSGLSCAKYLADAGHKPVVLEARPVLGGKVSAWQDRDGDWIETGLHIFFGAYPNMMNLLSELNVMDRLQWKKHRMAFAMRDRPGEFTSFDFVPGMPAPLGMALAILSNTQMLTWWEKLLMVPALLPMLLEGQSFIDAQDELSVTQFMEKFGMPRRVNDEIFIAMGKALDFIDPDRLSMTVVLTAMNRFINEADGSQTAFLDGNQPERLCAPMQEHIETRGGEVRTGVAVREIKTSGKTGEVTALRLSDGTELLADYYVSSVPVDVFKRLTPPAWLDGASLVAHFFTPLRALRGIPVINIQLWLDRKLASSLDGLAFSRSPLLSVYADMSRSCREYADDERSMLELVFAPCSPEAGSGGVDWLKKSDEEIIDAAVAELAFLFPNEIGPDARTALHRDGKAGGKAAVRKFSVVRVPRSVYAALPGMGKYRPSQETPVRNFILAGDWTAQKYLGSMEGAVLAGKLAAEVVVRKAAGLPTNGVHRSSQTSHAGGRPSDEAGQATDLSHTGVLDGNSPVAFGGGQAGGMVHP